jgi:hypothetical protein
MISVLFQFQSYVPHNTSRKYIVKYQGCIARILVMGEGKRLFGVGHPHPPPAMALNILEELSCAYSKAISFS